MKRLGVFALIVLAAGAAAASAGARHAAAPSAARCGGEFWRLKTFSDNLRRRVDLGVDQTTIGALRNLRAPAVPPARRATSYQLHTYEVPAQITSYKLEATGAIRLVLFDHGGYMNAVMPSPACLSRATRQRSAIEAARRLFVSKCGKPTPSWQSFGGILFVRGVGFWSQRRPLRGAAPNGAELHPVTGLRIVAGC